MTISREKETEILRLLEVEKWPLNTVARHVGVHHEVVERVLRQRCGEIEKTHSALRPRMIEPFIPFIAETLERYPDLRASRIHDMVAARGFTGSERRTRAAVFELRPRKPKRAAQPVTVLPGEQSQIDWGHLGRFTIDGAQRDVNFFVLCLSWSRAFWVELVLELTAASLTRSLVRAAQYFEGTTRQWVFDNAKTVVIDRAGANVRFHPMLLETAAQFHVLPKVCTPKRPNEKGRVERVMRYLRDRHFAARPFTSVDAGNRHLLHFIENIALNRAHPDDRSKTVRAMLVEEKSKLLALPETLPVTTHPVGATVDAYGYVRFETNFYAAPGLAGSDVQLVVSDRGVRISAGTQLVAEYPRSYGRGRRFGSEALDKIDAELGRQRRVRTGRTRLIGATPLMVSLMDAWLEAGHNVGSQVARALKLLELYGPAVFSWAVQQLAERGSSDLGALGNLCEVRRRELKKPPPSELKLGAHVPDRDVEVRSLEDYDG